MVKWKCLVCETKQESEAKPAIGQRLCKKCMVSHYKRLVDIYRLEKGFRYEEAKRLLEAAKKEVKA